MISVEEAVERIVAAVSLTGSEIIRTDEAAGRVLATEAVARFNQPPFSLSAMDGYAVRAADISALPATLAVIGSAPAGHPFAGTIGDKQALRIFTGGVVPDGADAVVIQENTDRGDPLVSIGVRPQPGNHIRQAGCDFRIGDLLARAGKILTARDVALVAAGDIATVAVRRRPRILIAATGDELSLAGQPRKRGGIVASSLYAVTALVEQWGAEVHNLGILPDRAESISEIAKYVPDFDLVVTLGGASVGDHDLIQHALGPMGFILDFWRIAMRPGKPLIFGQLGRTPLLGLPGNPVSSYVCALLFLRPAIFAMQGADGNLPFFTARLSGTLHENDGRQDYLRARLFEKQGVLWAEPFEVQDSAMQRLLAEADALIVRAPRDRPVKPGDPILAIRLE